MTDRFKILVEFTVITGPVGPWDSEQCAVDFIRHRIDEGYRLEDVIRGWDFVSVEKQV
jgi:hypothetical protein